VATHLANRCELDFLFVDRAFSSLSEVVTHMFGSKYGYFLGKIFTLVTFWTESNV